MLDLWELVDEDMTELKTGMKAREEVM